MECLRYWMFSLAGRHGRVPGHSSSVHKRALVLTKAAGAGKSFAMRMLAGRWDSPGGIVVDSSPRMALGMNCGYAVALSRLFRYE